MQTPSLPLVRQQKRLEWLDAMRGFTMILVVAHHVGTMSFNLPIKQSSAMEFMVLFRMPLFFFVSGFLAYSAKTVWSGKTLGSNLLKKVRIQLLPTLVFLFVFSIMLHKDWWGYFCSAFSLPYKGGYWFTWVLLLMFIAYYLFAYAEQKLLAVKKLHIPSWLPIVVLWIVSLGLYETYYMPKVFTFHKAVWSHYSSFFAFCMYFVFFLTGNICRRYWKQAERLFDSRWFFAVVVVIAFVCCTDYLKWHYLRKLWANLPRTIAIFSLLSIIIMYFRHYESSFSQHTRAGRMLQYIGRRTLDIYLIHYLLLPTMPMIGQWLKANRPNIVCEISLSVGVALLVIGFCCIVSSVLRTNKLFRIYLFGQKE